MILDWFVWRPERGEWASKKGSGHIFGLFQGNKSDAAIVLGGWGSGTISSDATAIARRVLPDMPHGRGVSNFY